MDPFMILMKERTAEVQELQQAIMASSMTASRQTRSLGHDDTLMGLPLSLLVIIS